jgi:hypothetical protein
VSGVLGSISAAAPSIAMLGCFACVGGGAVLIVRRQDYRKGVLMLVMAAVLFVNVMIWSW